MIAILGATGTLGLSLAHEFAADPRGLVLFARHPDRLANQPFTSPVGVCPLGEFKAADFDLVINAIGAGDPGRVAAVGAGILEITDRWDGRVLDTMAARTRYVFLSSGAVYGADRSEPVGGDSRLSIPADDRAVVPPYIMAKILAEARHRHLSDRLILDLRVFAYADAALPRDGRFFLCELARSIGSQVPFKTSATDMVRDYAGRTEVAAMIRCWEAAGARNTPLDVYTKAPARKSDILRLAHERFGIEIDYCADIAHSGTGEKPFYASLNRAAAALGYTPERTALEIVTDYLDGIAGSTVPTGAAS
jgi:nucleoside-diphosphate-sugar epimerase